MTKPRIPLFRYAQGQFPSPLRQKQIPAMSLVKSGCDFFVIGFGQVGLVLEFDRSYAIASTIGTI